MRNWVFDIQRFADWTLASADLTGPSSGNSTYYKISGATSGSASTITIGSASSLDGNAGSYYLKVTSTNGTYTFGFVTGNGNPYVTDTLAIGTLKFTAASGATAAVIDNTTSAFVTTLTMKSVSGGSVNNGTTTYTAASGKTATVTFAATATLDDGSVVLATGQTIQPNATVASGEVVKPTTGTVTVSSKGEVSGLAKGAEFQIGADADGDGDDAEYTVADDGLSIAAKVPAAGAAVTYLLTSALTNTTITSVAGVTSVDTISNGVKATALGFSIKNATPADVPVYGIANTTNQTYIYKKNGNIYQSGYADSSIGDFLGALKYDGSQYYMYDAKSSSVGQFMDGITNDVATILGGSGNDTLMATDGAAALGNTIAMTVDGGAGNDNLWVAPISGSSIVGGAGNDTIRTGTNAGAVASIILAGGDGNDSVEIADTTGTTSAWSVIGGAGNDTITIVNQTGAGVEWSIDSGDGNDRITAGTNITYSSILGGSGNDTIVSNSATNTVTGGAGADVFDIRTGMANIADFVYGEDAIRTAENTKAALITGVNTAASTAGRLTTEGLFDYNGGGAGAAQTATIASSAGFYAATITDDGSTKAKVDLAWVKDNATQINAASLTNEAVLVGTTNTEGDLLVGGTKADTIYAGASDSVYGGAGNDNIGIAANAYGVYVGVGSTSGKDTVTGFTGGFDIDAADAVYLVDGTVADASISNDGTGNVTVKSGKGTLEMAVAADGTLGATKLLFNDKKVYSIADNAAVTIASSDDIADYFYGSSNSGIVLTNYADDISVDLSNAMFKNIASVTGGSANTTIMGSTAAETLLGGTGATSLYGGAGKDSLVSGTGVTTFFLTTGAGRDSVSGFVTGTTEETSDVLNIFNAGLTGITRSAADTFTVKVSDTDSLQIAQATSGVDQKIQWVSGAANGVAKIGMNSQANSFTFEEGVTNYLGGSKNDTISFGSGSDDVNLWLDQTSAVSSIETFDASSRSGSVLIAGSSAAAETLRGGSGESSLWGGAGNQKDVLVGNTSGTTSFFYGMGQGSDSISGGSNDTVNLYDMQLSDLASATLDTANRRVIFTTTAGDTVTVSGGVQNFTVGGTTYQTSYASSSDWTAKA